VGELARGFTVSRPAISQHLRILKRAHLVVDRPQGNRRLYELNPAGVEALRAYFDRFWDQALAVYKRTAEARASPSIPASEVEPLR
jgi:DNA-binding transcriptional ArsR family regulator